MKNYVLPNFQTPVGIDSEEKVSMVQRRLGVDDDGVWGPKTQAAYERYLAIQPSLSVDNLNVQSKNLNLTQNGLEQIIQNLPGTTNPTIQTSGDSALKLHTMINASTLGPSLKSRAKFTIDGLDKERQDKLLLNVMLDGVDAYFSQEAWDQGAYSLMSADPSKRIHENVMLPGEGQARGMLVATLNNTAPMKATNLAASSSTSNRQQTNPSKIVFTPSQYSGRVMEEIDKNFDTIMRRMDYSNLSKAEKQSAYNMLISLRAVGNVDMERRILKEIAGVGIEEFFYPSKRGLKPKDAIPQYWLKFMEELFPTANKSALDDSSLTTNQRYEIISNAENYIGRYTYGRGKGEVDCSSFVYELYQKVGIDLKYPEDHDVAANIAKYVFTKGWGISKEDLKPGDLIFWDNTLKDKGRWEDIHHVGIYLCTDDNGKMWIIDSTPSQGGPAIQPIWSDTRRGSLGFLVYGYASVPNIQ